MFRSRVFISGKERFVSKIGFLRNGFRIFLYFGSGSSRPIDLVWIG